MAKQTPLTDKGGLKATGTGSHMSEFNVTGSHAAGPLTSVAPWLCPTTPIFLTPVWSCTYLSVSLWTETRTDRKEVVSERGMRSNIPYVLHPDAPNHVGATPHVLRQLAHSKRWHSYLKSMSAISSCGQE